MKKLLVFAMGWAVAIGCGARDSDGIDDAFMTSEVGVTGGIEESGPEARAILWVANQASQQSLLADVGLTATTAAEIVAARGLARFKSLAQLDDVPYVGPVAFWLLLDYVTKNGLVKGDPRQIYRSGDPLRLGDEVFVLHAGGLLIKERERVYGASVTTTTLWELELDADYLSVDIDGERLVAFGKDHLYLITFSGWIAQRFSAGYGDIPEIGPQLQVGSVACAVYSSVGGFYRGQAAAAYALANWWLGNTYTFWAYYFETLGAMCN